MENENHLGEFSDSELEVDEMEEKELNNKEKQRKKIKGILRFNSKLEKLRELSEPTKNDFEEEFEPVLDDESSEEYQEVDEVDN